MIIRGDVAAARVAFPRRLLRKRILAGVAGVLALLLVVAFAMRDEIERTMLLNAYRWTNGGDIAIGALHHDHGSVVLDRVRLVSNDGAAIVESDRVVYAVHGGTLDVTAESPRGTLALDTARADDIERAQRFLSHLGARALNMRIGRGTLRVLRAAEPARALTIEGIAGRVELSAASRTIDLTAVLGDGATRYPFSLRNDPASIDATAFELIADALPAAPITALLPSEDVTVHAGLLRHVDLIVGAAPHGTLNLENVSARIGAHEVAAMTGEVIVAKNGFGSRLIGGTVGAVPLQVSGEVHDLRDWAAAAAGGSRDLHALQTMFASIASQPNLKWINLDTTAPGVTFGQYAMTSKDPTVKNPADAAEIPHVVQLIAIDPREPTLRFDTAISGDHVISKGERTSDLGIRTHAIAGVNGDYFDIGRTYEPQGMVIRSGRIVRGPTDRAALVIDRDNKVTFAEFRLNGRAHFGGREIPVTQLNTWPAGDATVITPDYGTTLRPATGVTFASLAPIGNNRYRVVSVAAADRELPVTFGLAFGPKLKGPPPRPGQTIDLTYALDPAVPNAVAGVGGGPILLRNGEWYEDKHAPAPDERDVQWPVVALGTLPDQTLMLASVDGRHPERSIGMTRPEFANLLKGFGVIDAMALDSGGSVTMVSRAPGNAEVTVRNVPSDNSAERYISDALFVYSSAPRGTIVTTPPPSPAPSAAPKS